MQAVVHHVGLGDEGGHYITFCKDEKEKEWYSYDDNKVSKIPRDRVKEEVVNSNSYLLFYRRRERTAIDCKPKFK